MCVHAYMCTWIYIYIHMFVCIYIYMFMEREIYRYILQHVGCYAALFLFRFRLQRSRCRTGCCRTPARRMCNGSTGARAAQKKRQYPKILENNLKYQTRVATHIDLTHNIQYLILQMIYILVKNITINNKVLNRPL